MVMFLPHSRSKSHCTACSFADLFALFFFLLKVWSSIDETEATLIKPQVDAQLLIFPLLFNMSASSCSSSSSGAAADSDSVVEVSVSVAKSRRRFTPEDELNLLKEIVSHDVRFKWGSAVWEQISSNLCRSGKEFSARLCREKATSLVKDFLKADNWEKNQ